MNGFNKNVSLALALATAALVLGGCEKLTGTASLNRTVEAYTRGVGSQTLVLQPGTYNDAQIVFNSNTTKISLNGNTFRVNTPADLKRDGYKRDFNYSAATLDQTFGLQGDAQVRNSNGREYGRSESCVLGSHSESYQYCYPDERRCVRYEEKCRQRSGTNGDGRSDFDCHNECVAYEFERGGCETRHRTVTDYGSQQVYGYDQTSQELMIIKMKAPNGAILGTLNFAEKAKVNYVRTRTGSCN